MLNNLNISQIVEATQSQPESISSYGWENYGPNHHYFDFNSTFDSQVGLSCVADYQGKEIKELTLSFNNKHYLWVNPDYISSRNNAHFERNLDPRILGDNIKFIELEVIDDVLEKINTIFTQNFCDSKITVSLDLGEDSQSLVKILDELQETDPNFDKNTFIENALQNYISILQQKNYTFWTTIKNELNLKKINVNFSNEPFFIKHSDENKQLITCWLSSLELDNISITFKDKLTKTGLKNILCANNQFELELTHNL